MAQEKKKNFLENKSNETTKSKLADKFKKGGKSGIYIKPENRGKFTATKKATGKTTEELTHSKNPVTKKRAIFAQNSKKWKHENGGKVENTFGKDQPFPKLNKPEKKQKGGNVTATADSTKFYQKQVAENMASHFKAQGKDAKDEAAKKATQSKNSLNRQANKGKPGFDKNGFPDVKSKQKGGELNTVGDQASAYKKGSKIDASK